MNFFSKLKSVWTGQENMQQCYQTCGSSGLHTLLEHFYPSMSPDWTLDWNFLVRLTSDHHIFFLFKFIPLICLLWICHLQDVDPWESTAGHPFPPPCVILNIYIPPLILLHACGMALGDSNAGLLANLFVVLAQKGTSQWLRTGTNL